jgi:hypothetical protein
MNLLLLPEEALLERVAVFYFDPFVRLGRGSVLGNARPRRMGRQQHWVTASILPA